MLPIYTSPDDVTVVVDYLKTKATGATLAEAKAAIDKKLLDHRKIAAYKAWGFVTEEGDKLKLLDRGRRLGRAAGDQRPPIFAEAVRSVRAYRVATEWMFHQGFQQLSAIELAAHWHEHVRDELGTDAERTIRDQATCFFALAGGAGLGKYVIGRRGQETRFEIARDTLGQFIAETGLAPLPEAEPDAGAEVSTEHAPEPSREIVTPAAAAPTPAAGAVTRPEPTSEDVRVFISHGRNTDIVDQMKTMLDLADLKYEVAVEEETAAIPIPEKVFSAMRRCTAAVICVTADAEMKREDGSFAVNQNVLIEIGAAFVLYEKRVVLVWDRRIPVPSNLQGLYRCEFEGDELSWTAGMKLMKAVNQFKKS